VLQMNDCCWISELRSNWYQPFKAFLEHDAKGKHILENLVYIHCSTVMN